MRMIAMYAGRCPDRDPAPAFAFPEGEHGLDDLCRLFLSECKAGILAEPRQAVDVQLDKYGKDDFTIMRCTARFGGNVRLEFELRREEAVQPMGAMPEKIPPYRTLDGFGASQWDIVSHGARYPSDPDLYEARLDAFFSGDAGMEHEPL